MIAKVLTALTLVGLAACGPAASGSPSPTPTKSAAASATPSAKSTATPTAAATPTPAPLTPLVVVHTADYAAMKATVQLLNADGTKAQSANFANFNSIYVGTSDVYVLLGTELVQMDRNGNVTKLADVPSLATAGTIIFSPDGSQWMWSTGGCTGPTAIHLGSVAHPDVVVGTFDYMAGGQEGFVPAFAWFASTGPIFVRLPCGIGGAGPFIGESYGTNSETLNLANGKMTDFASATCSVDRTVATDGTYACTGNSGSSTPLQVHQANGTTNSLTVVQGGFVYEQSDGREFAANYTGEWPAGQYQTYSLSGSQATQFGPPGMEPWAFLPGGSLFGVDFNSQYWIVDKMGKAINNVQLPAQTTIDGVLP